MVPDRKARLLLVSSQASPPSSQASFQNATANLTDSSVAFESRATVLPSASTSLPPHDQRYGYVRVPEGRGVAERMSDRLADGKALGLELLAGLAPFLPRLRKCRAAHLGVQRFAVHDQVGVMACGSARQTPPTRQSVSAAG